VYWSGALDGIGEIGQSGEEVSQSASDSRVGALDADREHLADGEVVGIVGDGDAEEQSVDCRPPCPGLVGGRNAPSRPVGAV